MFGRESAAERERDLKQFETASKQFSMMFIYYSEINPGNNDANPDDFEVTPNNMHYGIMWNAVAGVAYFDGNHDFDTEEEKELLDKEIANLALSSLSYYFGYFATVGRNKLTEKPKSRKSSTAKNRENTAAKLPLKLVENGDGDNDNDEKILQDSEAQK